MTYDEEDTIIQYLIDNHETMLNLTHDNVEALEAALVEHPSIPNYILSNFKDSCYTVIANEASRSLGVSAESVYVVLDTISLREYLNVGK